MSSLTSRLAGAGLGALLLIGIGGAGLAVAQTAEETPSTTETPAATTPAPDTGTPDIWHARQRGLRGPELPQEGRLRWRWRARPGAAPDPGPGLARSGADAGAVDGRR